FGLSLSKPGAALRQAQRERVRGVERGKGCSATVRWVAGAGPTPHRGLGRTMAYPLPLTRPRRPSQRPRLNRHSICQPSQTCGQAEEGHEVGGLAVVTRGDASELLEPAEASLDRIASPV